jgi:hypothetical protein
MAKMGRPSLSTKQRQSRIFGLRLTPEESKALEKAAKKAGLSFSNYIRFKLKLRKKL